MESKGRRLTVDKVMGLIGLIAALTAAVCFLGGWETPGVVSVLVVFVVLCWFGLAF